MQDVAGVLVRGQHSAVFRAGARSGIADADGLSDGHRHHRLPRHAANKTARHSLPRRLANSRLWLGLLA